MWNYFVYIVLSKRKFRFGIGYLLPLLVYAQNPRDHFVAPCASKFMVESLFVMNKIGYKKKYNSDAGKSV